MRACTDPWEPWAGNRPGPPGPRPGPYQSPQTGGTEACFRDDQLRRLKDLADVLELIKLLALPADFADQLDPFVRDKYGEFWGIANADEEERDTI